MTRLRHDAGVQLLELRFATGHRGSSQVIARKCGHGANAGKHLIEKDPALVHLVLHAPVHARHLIRRTSCALSHDHMRANIVTRQAFGRERLDVRPSAPGANTDVAELTRILAARTARFTLDRAGTSFGGQIHRIASNACAALSARNP